MLTGARGIVSQDPSAAISPAASLPVVGWTKGIAPRFIALFLLLVYYDRLAIRTLLVGGLIPATLGVIVGGFLAYFLFFRPLAIWSLRTREPLERLAAATFGNSGGALVMRVVLGLALLVWFAVIIREAVDVTSRSLYEFGLIDFDTLVRQNPAGNRLFLGVAAIWSLTSAIIGTLAYKLVAAVMAGYQPFVALSLTALAGWVFQTAPNFVPLGYDPVTAIVPASPALFAMLHGVQWVCAYFAISAAIGADWGMASRDRRDVRDGGLVGIALAAPVLAIIAFLFVAGTLGRTDLTDWTNLKLSSHRDYQQALLGTSQATSVARARDYALMAGGEPFTVRSLIQHETLSFYAGTALLVFSVGFLGPACFAPYLASRLMSACWPNRPRWTWSLAIAFATWPFLVFDLVSNFEQTLNLLGGVVAPILGAVAAMGIRCRNEPAHSILVTRAGFHSVNLFACFVGIIVGISPTIATMLGYNFASQIPLPVILAYLTSFVLVFVLARGVGPKTDQPRDRITT